MDLSDRTYLEETRRELVKLAKTRPEKILVTKAREADGYIYLRVKIEK